MHNYYKTALVILLMGCLSMGCKQEEVHLPKIQIKTYTADEVHYPEKKIGIPDSINAHFYDQFFKPWELTNENYSELGQLLPGKEISYLNDYLTAEDWYGENKKVHTLKQREEIVSLVDSSTFPNFYKKGITIRHTNLRKLPSYKPGFDLYTKAGEGYPFDYFQETNLWANTPLQLLHLTKDKTWCYVISPYYKGWVPTQDIAITSEKFMEEWKTGQYALPIHDGVIIGVENTLHTVQTKVGMVLPYEDEGKDEMSVFYVQADENRNAQIWKAGADKSIFAFQGYEFNGGHLKQLVSELVGKPYDWGGRLGSRDCSALIRDMMATFRIWLPRDSKDQVAIGQRIELVGEVSEKLKIIKENAIPFQTILRKPGHNMLYLGEDAEGTPLIFHAIWGLKTSYKNEKLHNYLTTYPLEGIHKNDYGTLEGRFIIGEAVITSVLVGEDSTPITKPLLDYMYEMSVILESDKNN